MLEPNKDLEKIFENAIKLALDKKHEYITLEHFLLSMIRYEPFASLLKDFGVAVESFREEVNSYIDNNLSDIVNDQVEQPKKTNSVDKVISRAFTHVLFSGRHVIEPVDCFISIFAEKKSHALFFIKKANIDKEQFVDFVNRLDQKEEKEENTKTPSLHLEKIISQFCVNLTAKAKSKKLIQLSEEIVSLKKLNLSLLEDLSQMQY